MSGMRQFLLENLRAYCRRGGIGGKEFISWTMKGIIRSGNVKHELITELKRVIAEPSNKSIFTLFVIIAFVFALVISIL
jgi:hypothetical protein